MRRYVASSGYVMLTMPEHRLVAERKIGRELRSSEVVHHRNGDRADNRPENLRVFPSRSAHLKHHRRRESVALFRRYAQFISHALKCDSAAAVSIAEARFIGEAVA